MPLPAPPEHLPPPTPNLPQTPEAPLLASPHAPSLVKQKRMSATSRCRWSERRRPITMPRHVVTCWSRVYTRLDSGWKE